MLLLHGDELREGRAHRDVARVSGRDAAEERRHHPLRRLPAEAARRKVGDRLVLVPLEAARSDQRLERHARLAAPREETRRQQRREARGHPQHEAVGHDVEAIAPRDVEAPVLEPRPEERPAEADRAGQRGRLGLRHDPRVGACVEEEAVDALGDEDAAEARCALQHGDVNLAPQLAPPEHCGARRGQARDPTAHDDDAPGGRHVSRAPSATSSGRATSTRMSMRSSSSFKEGARTEVRPRCRAMAAASMSRS